jgi:hypothetical protein
MNFCGASVTIRPVLQHVAAQGYTVELAPGSGHWKVSDPVTRAFLCALSHTPSSRRAGARADSKHLSVPVLQVTEDEGCGDDRGNAPRAQTDAA